MQKDMERFPRYSAILFVVFAFVPTIMDSMEESSMNMRVTIIAALCIGLCCFLSNTVNQPGVQAASVEEPILTVLNPMGTPPPVQLKPMAPRLDTIEGKTIYIVNDGYPGSNILCAEMQKGFSEQFPKTTFVYKDKRGGMGGVDQALWTEMEEKADAMIIPLGH